MDAVEYEPGHWLMDDALDRPYALVDFVRRGDQLGYRVTTWAQDASRRELIGYFTNLRAACWEVNHRQNLAGQPHHPQPLSGHRAPGKANTPARMERD